MTDPTRVVAYLRDSGGTDQDLSVDQQHSEVTQWCNARGMHIYQVFADYATPGSSVVSRAAFLEMLAFFRTPERQADTLVLWKYSRFARDMDDAAFFKADLRRRGVTILSINDNVPDGLDGRLFENLIDWMNARFLEDLSSDVKRGLHHIVKTYGAVPGVPPRGFKREPITIGFRRDGTPHTVSRWVPDADMWELCKYAWQMRAAGETIYTIHKETHLFTSRPSYVTFFRNRIYLGELRYGSQIFENYCEPMISTDIWDAVQRVNRDNTHGRQMKSANHPRRISSSFLLSGLLHCPRCGSLMSGKGVTTRCRIEYYQCTNAHGKMQCDARLIPAKNLHEIVEKSLKEYILDPAVIAERDREQALASSGSRKELASEHKRINQQINDLRKKCENIAERIATEERAPKTLTKMLLELEDQEASLRDRLERVKSLENSERVFVRTAELAHGFVEVFHEKWGKAEFTEKQSILRSLVSRIVAERDGDVIRGMIYYYNPNAEDLGGNGDADCLPTCMSHRGASSHRQTFHLEFQYAIIVQSLLVVYV